LKAQADKAFIGEIMTLRVSAWQQAIAAVPSKAETLSKRIVADLR
jgi:hypothetical protein